MLARVGLAPRVQTQLQVLEESPAWQVVKALSVHLAGLWPWDREPTKGPSCCPRAICREVCVPKPPLPQSAPCQWLQGKPVPGRHSTPLMGDFAWDALTALPNLPQADGPTRSFYLLPFSPSLEVTVCHSLIALPSFSIPQPSSFHTGLPPNEILEHFVLSQHLLLRGCGLTPQWITVPSHHAYSKQGLEDLVECLTSGSNTLAGNSGARGAVEQSQQQAGRRLQECSSLSWCGAREGSPPPLQGT